MGKISIDISLLAQGGIDEYSVDRKIRVTAFPRNEIRSRRQSKVLVNENRPQGALTRLGRITIINI